MAQTPQAKGLLVIVQVAIAVSGSVLFGGGAMFSSMLPP